MEEVRIPKHESAIGKGKDLVGPLLIDHHDNGHGHIGGRRFGEIEPGQNLVFQRGIQYRIAGGTGERCARDTSHVVDPNADFDMEPGLFCLVVLA